MLYVKSDVKADVNDLQRYYGKDKLAWLFGVDNGIDRHTDHDKQAGKHDSVAKQRGQRLDLADAVVIFI